MEFEISDDENLAQAVTKVDSDLVDGASTTKRKSDQEDDITSKKRKQQTEPDAGLGDLYVFPTEILHIILEKLLRGQFNVLGRCSLSDIWRSLFGNYFTISKAWARLILEFIFQTKFPLKIGGAFRVSLRIVSFIVGYALPSEFRTFKANEIFEPMVQNEFAVRMLQNYHNVIAHPENNCRICFEIEPKNWRVFRRIIGNLSHKVTCVRLSGFAIQKEKDCPNGERILIDYSHSSIGNLELFPNLTSLDLDISNFHPCKLHDLPSLKSLKMRCPYDPFNQIQCNSRFGDACRADLEDLDINLDLVGEDPGKINTLLTWVDGTCNFEEMPKLDHFSYTHSRKITNADLIPTFRIPSDRSFFCLKFSVPINLELSDTAFMSSGSVGVPTINNLFLKMGSTINYQGAICVGDLFVSDFDCNLPLNESDKKKKQFLATISSLAEAIAVWNIRSNRFRVHFNISRKFENELDDVLFRHLRRVKIPYELQFY